MNSFSRLMLSVTVFSFMLTVVNLLPSVVSTFQARYKDRFGHLSREMDSFFIHLKATYIVIGSIALGIVLGVVTGSWILGITLAILGVFAPKIALAVWKNIRSAQVENQLMDALVLINNALRSGLDIASGIELITTNMKPPISEEFGTVLNAYRLGGSLETALVDLTRRVRSRPLETAVGAVLIQREMGGNLVKTFEQLIQTIREEAKLQKKVKALSAQGRTQIAFLAVFPWGLAVLFYMLSPDMFGPALVNPIGQAVLVGLAIWEAIGILVTKRLVAVDV